MQLRPHFLFNTLHTVASLVRAGRNRDAVRTVAGLSDLLREALRRDGAAEVPLHEELAFVEHYRAIEQIRFQERLDASIVAGDDVLDALVLA
jgi:sensor histidine kinase YesM